MKGKKFLSLGMAAVLACSAFPATSYAMETDAEVYEETDIIGDEEEGGGSSEDAFARVGDAEGLFAAVAFGEDQF